MAQPPASTEFTADRSYQQLVRIEKILMAFVNANLTPEQKKALDESLNPPTLKGEISIR